MLEFRYHSPVEIRFGYGSRDSLGEVAGRLGRTGFLVIDPAVEKAEATAGFLAKWRRLFAATSSNVLPNPTIGCVQAIADQLRSARADFVVALGGGSTIDAA